MIAQNKRKALFFWGLCTLFYAYQYILRVVPSILVDDYLVRFNMDVNIFGHMSGLYYVGYAAAHIPLGILLDRFGPRKVLFTCCLLTALSNLPLIMSEFWIYPLIGRFITGIGSSAAILGLFKIISMNFKESEFTKLLGISVTISLIGAIYGGQPLKYLINIYGRDTIIFILILSGIKLAISFLFVSQKQEITNSSTSIRKDLKKLLQNKRVIIVSILSGLMVGPMEGFADIWGIKFLTTTYNFPEAIAASLPSFIFVGMCTGTFLIAMINIDKKSSKYYHFLRLCAVVMAAGFILLLCGVGNSVLVSIVLFLIGIMCAYQVIAIAKVSSLVNKSLTGISTSFCNMIIMSFGYFFHVSIGKISYSFQASYPSENSYRYAIAIIPIALIVAAFGFTLLSIKEEKIIDNSI